jgi:hypothetical protein
MPNSMRLVCLLAFVAEPLFASELVAPADAVWSKMSTDDGETWAEFGAVRMNIVPLSDNLGPAKGKIVPVDGYI